LENTALSEERLRYQQAMRVAHRQEFVYICKYIPAMQYFVSSEQNAIDIPLREENRFLVLISEVLLENQPDG
jgi:hypothetical protein